jgi:hypothetical protein
MRKSSDILQDVCGKEKGFRAKEDFISDFLTLSRNIVCKALRFVAPPARAKQRRITTKSYLSSHQLTSLFLVTPFMMCSEVYTLHESNEGRRDYFYSF